jgi:predicted nuclease of predicted toxin-antitoxin system
MRLLFDQGTPVPLRKHLLNHKVETAYERGWSNLKNGDLLTQAEAEGFDALITTDQNLRYQQNLTGRKISVVVLLTTNWPRIRNSVSLAVQVIDNLHPGSYEEVPFP